MAELTEQRLSVTLEKTGETTDGIENYSISSDYTTPTDEFDFVVYDAENPAALRRKWQPLQRVVLKIDGQTQLIGRIDATEGVGRSGSALRVSGRDYLAELVDGGADPSIRFAEGTSLGDAILDLGRPFGIDTVVGSFNLTRNLLTGKSPFSGSPPKDFKAARMKDFMIESGMGTFEAMSKIAARHGFMVQSGGDRKTLAVVEPLYGQDPLYALERPGNVLDGSAKRDYGDIPTVTIFTGREGSKGSPLRAINDQVPSFGTTAQPGQQQRAAFNEAGRFPEVLRIVFGDIESGDIPEVFMSRVNWKRAASPASAGILYRPMFVEDKLSKTREEMTRALRKDLSRRMMQMLTYSATVRGHRDPKSGAIWSVDTVCSVRDEIEDVNELMWILGRDLVNDGTGPKTNLRLVRAGSIAL